MKIHFLGGADEVGASCLLLEMGGQRIMVDAGIRVSPKARDGLSGELLPDLSPLSDNAHLDAIIITHAHADHIGAVPIVLGAMPDIPVYATPATIEITKVMLADALRIMDTRVEAEGELPSYDSLQVERLEQAMKPIGLRQEFFIGGTVRVRFFRAGHIPGAVSVYLESGEGTMLVSGDLSFSPMRATPRAEIPPVHPDMLILETTYGGKLHANRRAEEMRLIESIVRITENGGRVLIPAFALGRAQEVALILDAAMAQQKMPPVPVYLDGMARAITKVFEKFPDYLSKGLQKYLEKNGPDMWQSQHMRPIKSKAHREEVARNPEPAVIIASSGMLTGGASPVYAAHVIKEKQSAIYITGYQDEEAPGRHLQNLAEKGSGVIRLSGKKYQVECEIGTYSLSAHADENELVQFAQQLQPQQTFLVHGETDPRYRIRELLRERQMLVSLPRLGLVMEPQLEIKPYLKALNKRGIGKDKELTGKRLWETLVESELAGATFNITQFIQFWYGDDAPADAVSSMGILLKKFPLYYIQDWRNKDVFKVRQPDGVKHKMERYVWLEENRIQHGEFRSRRMLGYNNAGKPYLAVILETKDDQVKCVTVSHHQSLALAEQMVTLGREWKEKLPDHAIYAAGQNADSDSSTEESYDDEALMALQTYLEKEQQELDKNARTALTLGQIAELCDSQARTLEQIGEKLNLDMSDIDTQIRVAWRLLDFGAKVRFGQFKLDEQAIAQTTLDFNHARTMIMELLPDAGIRKLSPDASTNTITIKFDFPAVAGELYKEQMEQAKALTGWNIEVHPSVHQGALDMAVRELIPEVSQVSVHLALNEVEIKADTIPALWDEIQEAYEARTGFRLLLKGQTATDSGSGVPIPVASSRSAGAPMEINTAYGMVKSALQKHGLYKAGLKNGEIVLAFVTPEVGERHRDTINQLAQDTGYPMRIHPHPNQHELINIILQLCLLKDIRLKKNPSLRIAEKRVEIVPIAPMESALWEELSTEFLDKTGYELAMSPEFLID